MTTSSVTTLVVLFFLSGVPAVAGPVTGLPDAEHGKDLASRPPEIANKEGQSAGAIMAHIMLPKHPMPTIPLTKSELADLSAYILSHRQEE